MGDDRACLIRFSNLHPPGRGLVRGAESRFTARPEWV
jgi:hypothetical protein